MASPRTTLLLASLLWLPPSCGSNDRPETPPGPVPESATAPPVEAMEGPGGDVPADKQALLSLALTAMQARLGDGFHTAGRFPFAVGSDLPEARLKIFLDHTVFNAYKAFNVQFFKRRPDHVLKIYLFNGRDSYRRNAERLWGDHPSTPYGYYVPSRTSLIMNIQTGGGTLVHELFHSLSEIDFPGIPKWIDEGMASLFEQCHIEYERIFGLENWRLPILKRGIAENRTLPLRRLMATTRDEFLDEASSLHYAQARYFCMYMQDQGVLERFYRAYRDRFEEDPTGATFAEELFEKPLEEVEADMLRWVQTIHYRR